jgi:F-type H+-transporting ATPase subunit b
MLNSLTFLATIAQPADPEAIEQLSQIDKIFGQFGIATPFLIAQIVNFCLVAFLLYRFAIKPILTTIDERQRVIADGLQYAEEMKSKLADAERQHAETLKKASHEAQAILQDARNNAQKYLDEQTQEAAHKAESIIKKALEATDLERQKMLSDIRKEVAELVVATTEKVLSKKLSDDDRNTFAQAAADGIAANQ